jgi:hypothetical protein
VLSKLGLLNHVAVSPEIQLAPRMIDLARLLLRRGLKVINMFVHSPTLMVGCSPFTRTEADVDAFLVRIDRVLEFAQAAGLKPVTLSELTPAAVGASVSVIPSTGVRT